MSGSHLPKSRLNQIAQRKLSTWGVRTVLSPSAELLSGELTIRPGVLTNPFDNHFILRAKFAAEGHDHLSFSTPPVLATLAPQPFYDFPTLEAFASSLEATLRRRHAGLTQMTKRLKDFNYDVHTDMVRGLVAINVELDPSLGVVTVEGDERGLFAVKVSPIRSRDRAPIALKPMPIEFSAFTDRPELEIDLSQIAEAAIAGPPQPKSTPRGAVGETGDLELQLMSMDLPRGTTPREPSGPPMKLELTPPRVPSGPPMKLELELELEASAPLPRQEAKPAPPAVTPKKDPPAKPRAVEPAKPALMPREIELPIEDARATLASFAPPGSLNLGLLVDKLGRGTLAGAGVAFSRDVLIGDKRARFEMKHIEDLTFHGRFSTSAGTVWSERFDLETFPGLQAFAELMLGQEEPAKSVAEPEAITLMVPKRGELWAMRAVVEHDDGREVRYVPLNADGRPYGAPRVLPSAHFSSVFVEHDGGWRLRVLIESSDGQTVTYRRHPPIQGTRSSNVPFLAFVSQFFKDS